MYIYVKYIIFYLLYLLFYICVICSILYIKNIYFICWSKLCSVGGVYVKHSPASPFLCPSLPPGGAGGAGEAADAGGLTAPLGGEGPAGSLAGHGRAGAGRGAATHPAVAGGWPFARPGRGGVQVVAPLDAAPPFDAPFACSRMGLGSFWGSSQLGEMLALLLRCAGLLLGSFPAWRGAGLLLGPCSRLERCWYLYGTHFGPQPSLRTCWCLYWDCAGLHPSV